MNTSIKVHQTFLRINMHDGIIAQVLSKIKRIFQFDALSALRAPNVGEAMPVPADAGTGACAPKAHRQERRFGAARASPPQYGDIARATLERSLAAS